MYLGNQPALSYTSFAKQDFTTSATTSYTLDNPVANANELALFINFVRQEPTTAYTASGTSLTLTSATSASDDMYAIFLGKAVQTVNPPAGSVGTSQLANGAVTSDKLASGVGGKVLQVVSTHKSDTFTTTSTSFTDITGLSVTITPSSSSNKILVSYDITGSESVGANRFYLRLLRGATVIGGGATEGSRFSGIGGFGTPNNTIQSGNVSGTFLDSPSTTSATTYKIQGSCTAGGNTGYINRTQTDDNESGQIRSASNITVYEIEV